MGAPPACPARKPKAKRRPRIAAACFAFFAFFLPAVAQPSAGEDSYLVSLLSRAREGELASERPWRILLHYHAPPLGREGSLIDDPAFFLSPRGKNDPAAELEGTLKGLFAPPALGDAHPRCRFPARAAWLEERLGIDRERLPSVACAELQQALDKVQPRSAVLIFPGSHVNSPASMFGHTLLNIEGPYESKLLSYAVNYAASTDETNGIAYAFKGITGLYRGYFSILPYYDKVREYNDMERRDIWEYELDLTPEEVKRLFLHVWELKEIYSDYFFFGENCSYNLLFLLEAARPSLRLTEETRPWVIPVDTVRLVREAGLVRETAYRPSKATRIRRLVEQMDEGEKKAAAELLSGGRPPSALAETDLSPEGRRRVLDLGVETVEFRYLRGELPLEEYKKRYIAILAERSRLGRAAEAAASGPDPERPDRGHGSNRLALGGGVRRDDPFVEVRLRPAYHHLLDADEGYLPGSQILFADLALRWYPEREQAELHSFDLIDIVSLSPRHRFFRPVSWKLSTGFFQKTFDDGDDHLVYRLNPGGGFTWGDPQTLAYGFGETDLQVGGRFRDDFALGVGGSAGVLKTIGRGKIHLWGRKIYFPIGDPHQSLALHLDGSLRTGPDSALTLELSRQESFGSWFSEARLGWNIYW